MLALHPRVAPGTSTARLQRPPLHRERSTPHNTNPHASGVFTSINLNTGLVQHAICTGSTQSTLRQKPSISRCCWGTCIDLQLPVVSIKSSQQQANCVGLCRSCTCLHHHQCACEMVCDVQGIVHPLQGFLQGCLRTIKDARVHAVVWSVDRVLENLQCYTSRAGLLATWHASNLLAVSP